MRLKCRHFWALKRCSDIDHKIHRTSTKSISFHGWPDRKYRKSHSNQTIVAFMPFSSQMKMNLAKITNPIRQQKRDASDIDTESPIQFIQRASLVPLIVQNAKKSIDFEIIHAINTIIWTNLVRISGMTLMLRSGCLTQIPVDFRFI